QMFRRYRRRKRYQRKWECDSFAQSLIGVLQKVERITALVKESSDARVCPSLAVLSGLACDIDVLGTGKIKHPCGFSGFSPVDFIGRAEAGDRRPAVLESVQEDIASTFDRRAAAGFDEDLCKDRAPGAI